MTEPLYDANTLGALDALLRDLQPPRRMNGMTRNEFRQARATAMAKPLWDQNLIDDMSAREFEAFLRKNGASRRTAKVATAGFARTSSEPRADENPTNGPATRLAIQHMFDAVSKKD